MKGVLKMSFGEKLKYYRKMNRYSQKQLANELGIALSTYGKYETNEYQPKFDTLINICRKLSVTPNDLLEYNDSYVNFSYLGFQIVDSNDETIRIKLDTNIFNYNDADIYFEPVVLCMKTDIFYNLINYVNDGVETEAHNYAYRLRLNRFFYCLLRNFDYIQFDNPDKDITKFIHALQNINLDIQIANKFKR